MKKLNIITLCIVLTIISCKNDNKSASQEQEAKTDLQKGDDLKVKDIDSNVILKDESYFKIAEQAYTFKNITYNFERLSFSPYFRSSILVKKSQIITDYRTSDGSQTLTRLEIISDLEKSKTPDIIIEKPADNIFLYSHHYECSYEPQAADDVSHIELFNYKNDSIPFAESDNFYWLFNMSSSTDFTAKTNYFITITKDYENKFLHLNLCDKSGVLQCVKVLNKSENEIEFWNPRIDLVSKNPYQYQYSANESNLCETISISVKDTASIRKHITKTSIKLKYLTTTGKTDSVNVLIENGYFYGRTDKVQEIEIFRN